jgi:hypothetical protein
LTFRKEGPVNSDWVRRQLTTESRRLHVARIGTWTLYADLRKLYWDWRNGQTSMESVATWIRFMFGEGAEVQEMESGQDPDPGPGLVVTPRAHSVVWIHVAPDVWTVYLPKDGEWTAKDVELIEWLYASLGKSPAWWDTTELSKAENQAVM